MAAVTMRLRIGKNALRAICLGIVGVSLAAGLWPFNPLPHNQVSWLGNRDGLLFGNRGVVLSSANFRWPPSVDTAPCALEIWLQPGTNSEHRGIILAFYQSRAPERLKLFRWHDSILILYKDDGRSRHQEIDFEGALRPDTPLLITVTSSDRGTSVYMNGVLAQTSSRFALSRRDLAGQLVLGTSPVNDNGWAGQLRGLAIYEQELTPTEISRHVDAWSKGVTPETAAGEGATALYTFSERTGRVIHDRLSMSPDLYIPESYRIAHKPLLIMPWVDFRWNRNEAQDVAVNLVGFIPLGFFFCAFISANLSRRRAALAAIVFGTALSLAIEVLQVYLPTRTSSMTDVITNVLGTCIGVLLYCSNIARPLLDGRDVR